MVLVLVLVLVLESIHVNGLIIIIGIIIVSKGAPPSYVHSRMSCRDASRPRPTLDPVTMAVWSFS